MTALTLHSEPPLEISGVELQVLDGAGNDLPRPVWGTFVPALIRPPGRGRS